MTWKPMIAGVDASPQAVAAAAFAWRLAQEADAECYLVHGTRPLFGPPAAADFLLDADLLVRQQLAAARDNVTAALQGGVPEAALKRLEVRLGRGGWALGEVARERDAGLIVIGGKHHTLLQRWMGGNTAHHLVRTVDLPILVTGERTHDVHRILAAIDLSHAVQPTFETAARFARLLGAELRVMHAVEPLPVFAELPMELNDEAFFEDSKEQFERCMEPLVSEFPASRVVRRGFAPDVIAEEARDWKADLVVTGSHGKGWVDRLLVGSTTERLLDHLPAALLVVPVPAPPGEDRGAREKRATRRTTGSRRRLETPAGTTII